MHVTPRATMRLQFNAGFTFDDAAALVGYMHRLGISHVYASPILAARAGSAHGYDVIDPTRISDEIGGRAGLERLVAALRRHEMGLILDIVPNHLAVGGDENPWWADVLAKGEASPHARVFDIDWRHPDPERDGKVHAPFLGEDYNRALASGTLRLCRDAAGRVWVKAHDRKFPIRDEDLPAIFGEGAPDAAEADRLLARYHEPESGPRALHRLLDHQHYRLAWWRTAADEVNWRRFFDIGELAGVRVEDPEVFEATHGLIFELYAAGLIDGLRVDHIDGLADPGGYCRRLRARLEDLRDRRPAAAADHAPLILVEKILAPGERLPEDWPVEGTTGYDFMAELGGLLHDPSGRMPLRSLWREITGEPDDPEAEVEAARRQILATAFEADLARTVRAFAALARSRRRDRDLTTAALRRVLTEVVIQVPVYRIYDTGDGHDAADDATIAGAIDRARAHVVPGDRPALERLADWLHGGRAIEGGGTDASAEAGQTDEADPDMLRRAALIRFQQLTAPLAAKAVEDTVFYRQAPLLSCNEVGSEPGAPTLSPAAFHQAGIDRRRRHPMGLLATATHDHKRGPDNRMRLAVLSEMVEEWSRTVKAWRRMNMPSQVAPSQAALDGHTAPHPADELMLYQTLIGLWPAGLDATRAARNTAAGEILPRVEAWWRKALREGKRRSNWVEPDTGYEAACLAFLQAIMGSDSSFPEALDRLVRRITPAAMVNTLAQTVLQLTCPGIPDIYRGSEVLDLSLVDPDNRRPVDHARLAGLLAAETEPAAALESPRDHDAAKQAVIARILALRARDPALFLTGNYLPLTVTGPAADHLLAFARVGTATEGAQPPHAIILVSRLADRLIPEGGAPLIPAEGSPAIITRC
jgi:(1->4)-alpha-D-glucan 1-alpha-D-glucosylmutase